MRLTLVGKQVLECSATHSDRRDYSSYVRQRVGRCSRFNDVDQCGRAGRRCISSGTSGRFSRSLGVSDYREWGCAMIPNWLHHRSLVAFFCLDLCYQLERHTDHPRNQRFRSVADETDEGRFYLCSSVLFQTMINLSWVLFPITGSFYNPFLTLLTLILYVSSVVT